MCLVFKFLRSWDACIFGVGDFGFWVFSELCISGYCYFGDLANLGFWNFRVLIFGVWDFGMLRFLHSENSERLATCSFSVFGFWDFEGFEVLGFCGSCEFGILGFLRFWFLEFWDFGMLRFLDSENSERFSICSVSFSGFLRFWGFWGFVILGFGDFAILDFLGLCRFSFGRFSDYEAFCVWISTVFRSCDFCFLGYWDLGTLGFWDFGDSPLGRPHPRSGFPQLLSSIFAQEAAASTPREGVGVLFAVCALERPWRILVTDPGGNIYLTGNLAEAADTGTANDPRNQMQLGSCHPRNASQEGQVSFRLRFEQTANNTKNIIIKAIETSRLCRPAVSKQDHQDQFQNKPN